MTVTVSLGMEIFGFIRRNQVPEFPCQIIQNMGIGIFINGDPCGCVWGKHHSDPVPAS
jgi:hypothetical protein